MFSRTCTITFCSSVINLSWFIFLLKLPFCSRWQLRLSQLCPTRLHGHSQQCARSDEHPSPTARVAGNLCLEGRQDAVRRWWEWRAGRGLRFKRFFHHKVPLSQVLHQAERVRRPGRSLLRQKVGHLSAADLFQALIIVKYKFSSLSLLSAGCLLCTFCICIIKNIFQILAVWFLEYSRWQSVKLMTVHNSAFCFFANWRVLLTNTTTMPPKPNLELLLPKIRSLIRGPVVCNNLFNLCKNIGQLFCLLQLLSVFVYTLHFRKK